MRKYLICFVIFALMACLMTGCGAQKSSDPSCADILNDMMYEDGDADYFDTMVACGNEDLDSNYDNMYAVSRDLVDDYGLVYMSEGGLANELSLLHLKDSGDVSLAKEKLQDRLETRRNQFAGYKPEEVYKLDNAVIMSMGNFVALIITPDPSMTEATLRECISNNQ